MEDTTSRAPTGRRSWTFLTNHGHVLVCIARDPGVRIRDIAVGVGITERAAQRIVAELLAGGYISRTRVGRRNRYELRSDLPMRHPLEHDHEVGALLRSLVDAPGPESRGTGANGGLVGAQEHGVGESVEPE